MLTFQKHTGEDGAWLTLSLVNEGEEKKCQQKFFRDEPLSGVLLSSYTIQNRAYICVYLNTHKKCLALLVYMNLKSFCPHTQITVYFFTTNTEWLRQLVWAWPRVIWDKLIRRSCSITAAHTSKLWVPRGPFPVNTIKKKIPLCHSHQELLPWTKKQNNKQKKTTWWVREPFMEIM